MIGPDFYVAVFAKDLALFMILACLLVVGGVALGAWLF